MQRFRSLIYVPPGHKWRRQWHPTSVLLPGKSHGRRSLVGCSPWGHEESDTTERLHFHFSLSCIGEGNGNPLQCSCLENPRDGGAWWAAVYGVAQSWTRLKQLSSSSSSRAEILWNWCSSPLYQSVAECWGKEATSFPVAQTPDLEFVSGISFLVFQVPFLPRRGELIFFKVKWANFTSVAQLDITIFCCMNFTPS